MSKKVFLNKWGAYEVIDKPSQDELERYYADKYFQEEEGNYSESYSQEEIDYFYAKLEQKYEAIKPLLDNTSNKASILDIGCGEGFALKFFNSKGWNVTGLDFSSYGCKKMNPEMSKYLVEGDVFSNLLSIIQSDNKYDLIIMNNLLEHVVNPFELLVQCKKACTKNGILIIQVPNDFSYYQQFLLDEGCILDEFWVKIPDHLFYFSKDSLINLCTESGWLTHNIYADFPIDIFLINEESNYIIDRKKGKAAHQSRIKIENLFHKQSISKTNALYKAMADMDFGRQLIGIFTNKSAN